MLKIERTGKIALSALLCLSGAAMSQDLPLGGVKNLMDKLGRVQKEVENINRPTQDSANTGTRQETPVKEADKGTSSVSSSSSSSGSTPDNEKASAKQEEIPMVVKFLMDEVTKIQEQVEKYDPKERLYMVNNAEEQWLRRAVSPRAREEWSKDFFKSGVAGKTQFYQRLDALAAAGAKKIPINKPNPKNFAYHVAGDEAMMKRELPKALKVHQIGTAGGGWDFQKNGLGIPEKRYRVGYVWGKNPGDDFPYCLLYQVNIIQDYAGGGSYGQSKAVYLNDWLVSCP